MSTTPPPAITPVPEPAPQRGDRATFADRFDAFITWVIGAVAQFAALATNVYQNAVSSFDSAVAAALSASSAEAAAEAAAFAASAPEWVSGANYAKGFTVWSNETFQSYRRRVAGAGVLDPSSDPVNWAGINRQSRFAEVPLTALDIKLSDGDYFTKTISTNSTFTLSAVPPGGSSFTLELRHDGGSVAFPASVTPANGAMPTLTVGKTHLFMFSTKDGGTRWRVTVAANFTN